MKTIPGLLLAAILCCVFAAPPASAGKRQYDLPETGEPLPNSKTLPNEEQVLQFLEWEEQQANTWDIDIKKAYAKSAAYGIVYATCLREHKYLKAGESTLVADILLAATAYLTDRQIATLAVRNEYGDVQRITRNCARLTNLEGNYDLVYFAKLTELKTFVSTWSEGEQTSFLESVVHALLMTLVIMFWVKMDNYARRKKAEQSG